jgi:hypothetical protein
LENVLGFTLRRDGKGSNRDLTLQRRLLKRWHWRSPVLLKLKENELPIPDAPNSLQSVVI